MERVCECTSVASVDAGRRGEIVSTISVVLVDVSVVPVAVPGAMGAVESIPGALGFGVTGDSVASVMGHTVVYSVGTHLSSSHEVTVTTCVVHSPGTELTEVAVALVTVVLVTSTSVSDSVLLGTTNSDSSSASDAVLDGSYSRMSTVRNSSRATAELLRYRDGQMYALEDRGKGCASVTTDDCTAADDSTSSSDRELAVLDLLMGISTSTVISVAPDVIGSVVVVVPFPL